MYRAMSPLLKFVMLLLRCIPAFFRSRNEQAIVELALRQQLATFALNGPKPRITSVDRAFWILLSRIWSGWKDTLVIVQPDTVVRWHRKGFRLYWRFISRPGPGRPHIPAEVQTLIRRFANENDWRARKVQAELEKLGFSVSLATVSRYLPKRNTDHDQRQRWKTFLRNHKDGIAHCCPHRSVPHTVRLVFDRPRKKGDPPLRRDRSSDSALCSAAAPRGVPR